MRKRDQLRYQQLAVLLKQRREESLTTLAVVELRSGLAAPLVSDFERHERIPDLFDFVRWVRALGFSDAEAMALVDSLMADRSLDLPPIPPPPPRKTKGNPKQNRKPRRK